MAIRNTRMEISNKNISQIYSTDFVVPLKFLIHISHFKYDFNTILGFTFAFHVNSYDAFFSQLCIEINNDRTSHVYKVIIKYSI